MNLQINTEPGSDELLDELITSKISEGKKPKMSEDMKFFVESSFHRGNLNQIKKRLKGKLTYLSHLSRPEYKNPETNEAYDEPKTAYFIKANVVNSTGGTDKVLFRLGVTPEEMSQDDYIMLLNELDNENYAKG
jgi:hypothetical protein